MVTFVVSLFLPYTVDFHHFDDPDDTPKLKRVSSSRSTSTIDLSALGKRAGALSLLGDYDVTPLLGRKRSSLVNLLHLRDASVQQKLSQGQAWTRADAQISDVRDFEAIDKIPNRLDSILYTPPLALDPRSTLPSHQGVSPIHSRKSSLAFATQNQPLLGKISPFFDPSRKHDDSSEPIWTVEPALLVNGGLANGVKKAMEQAGSQTTWIGIIGGDATDSWPATRKEEVATKFAEEYNAEVIYVSDEDFLGHYEHFCKIILWPVLHYHMPDSPKTKAYEDDSWSFYKNVNRAFADRIIQSYKQGDDIWIHDYHLMLVPGMVREKLPEAKIGFFFHTAFPSSEIFRCVWTRKELLEGVLGANLIGFQIPEYASHFLQTCARVLLLETQRDGVHYNGRLINITSQPIGIVHEAIDHERDVNTDHLKFCIAELKEQYAGRILIVARDKLDSIRGIRQKLLSYEYFLAVNPDLKNKVVFIQVATSTTELIELQVSVHDIVQRITDRHGSLEQPPIEFLTQDMPFTSYVALMSAADILFITTLREGMGLTAQEFVYCQDGALYGNKYGPVVLSEFTGTSVLFAGRDLPVNPWDFRRTAEQLRKAIFMAEDEKAFRWHELHRVIMSNTGQSWWEALQEKLHKVHYDQHFRTPTNIPRLDVPALCNSYEDAQRRLIILGNRGTLISDPINPESHRNLCKALTVLTADADNLVYVSSSLSPTDLEATYSSVPNLGLVASNGLSIHPARSGRGTWVHMKPLSTATKWKADIRSLLKYYIDRLHGATLHDDTTSMLIDFSSATHAPSAAALVGELLNHINEGCRSLNIQAIPLPDKRVIIEPSDMDKSTAANFIWEELSEQCNSLPANFLMIAGDDRDDEPLFRWGLDVVKYSGGAVGLHSISLGSGNTDAGSTLSGGPSGMAFVLRKLTAVSKEKMERAVQEIGRERMGEGTRGRGVEFRLGDADD